MNPSQLKVLELVSNLVVHSSIIYIDIFRTTPLPFVKARPLTTVLSFVKAVSFITLLSFVKAMPLTALLSFVNLYLSPLRYCS